MSSPVLTFFLMLNLFPFLNAIDIITQTLFISDARNETIISSNGNFKLGFFSPINSGSRYLGIWFNKISQQTVCWVANRETPLQNSSGTFGIASDGNLAVFSGNASLWSTNVSLESSTITTTKLLSSGNLVLLLGNGSILWQSFDFPTDTILPGMKFGWNQKTGVKQVLTSWKSSENPGMGDYSLGVSLNGTPQYFMYKNLDPYWRGVIVISNWLAKADYSTVSSVFNYSFVHNDEETYLMFNTYSSSVYFKVTVEPEGTCEGFLWEDETRGWRSFLSQPDTACSKYAHCGAYGLCDFSNSLPCACLPGYESRTRQDLDLKCVEKIKYDCGKGTGEGFSKLSNVKIPDATNARAYGNLSLEDCARECSKNCKCIGYASSDINGGPGCLAWDTELKDMQRYKSAGQDFYLRVDALDLITDNSKSSSKKHVQKNVLVIVIVSVVLLVLISVSALYFFHQKQAARKGKKERQRRRAILLMDSEGSPTKDQHHSPRANQNNKDINDDLTFFDLDTIIAATDDFSLTKKLGQGGFGPVYKGQLPNGQEIAIKKLSKNSGQGMSEFKNEVVLIAKLQHRNLVKLLGCCVEEDERMLIYEYMLNRSLDYFIFGDQSKKAMLNWAKRFEIMEGIARGILYLHQDSRLRIIHRDLKTSNILLDGEMTPKISDFGTARIFEGNQSHANTCRVVGTFGYMSPEYALDGLFSMKSDIYSFGVMLLEIISGHKNNAGFFEHDGSCSNLIAYVWNLWENDKTMEAVDPCIKESCPIDVMRCIHLGLLCVQDSAENRPNMSNVIFMLSNGTDLPPPKEPSFAIMRRRNVDPMPTSNSTGTHSSSVNEVTLTVLEAR